MTTKNRIARRDKILKGLEKAYEKMLEFKRKNNSEVVIMREDKIVKIKPSFALPTTLVTVAQLLFFRK